ncbi:hypothetical protein T484DRAFT_1770650 [Baffinella frigidus]|nr:hypothetical protein T484DRAFT_1770650 [Cryptophyta sp. CCMP2293]
MAPCGSADRRRGKRWQLPATAALLFVIQISADEDPDSDEELEGVASCFQILDPPHGHISSEEELVKGHNFYLMVNCEGFARAKTVGWALQGQSFEHELEPHVEEGYVLDFHVPRGNFEISMNLTRKDGSVEQAWTLLHCIPLINPRLEILFPPEGFVETPGTEAIRGPMRYILDIQLTATSPHDNSTVFPESLHCQGGDECFLKTTSWMVLMEPRRSLQKFPPPRAIPAMLSPENRIIPRASDLIFLHPLHPDVNFEPRAADFALSVKLWDASYSVFVQTSRD